MSGIPLESKETLLMNVNPNKFVCHVVIARLHGFASLLIVTASRKTMFLTVRFNSLSLVVPGYAGG